MTESQFRRPSPTLQDKQGCPPSPVAGLARVPSGQQVTLESSQKLRRTLTLSSTTLRSLSLSLLRWTTAEWTTEDMQDMAAVAAVVWTRWHAR